MTTYSISLDDVDLAFLPLRTSYNNFLKKDHYNFEVKKTVTFEVPEPRSIYKCHICAIDMPAAFAREHAASVKHRANARIASVAAQRMFALITALPPPSDEQSSARFCTNCATLADEHHNNTKEHQDAVKYDALLWDLMKAYAQNDEEFPDNEENQDNINKINEYKDDNVQHGNEYATNNGMLTHSGYKNQPIEQTVVEQKIQVQEDIAKKFEINNNLKQHEDDEFGDDISDDTDDDTIDTMKSSDDIVDSQIGYPYEVTVVGHVRCVVCDCKVTGGQRNREEHVGGRRHRINMVIHKNQPTELIEDKEEEQLADSDEVIENLEENSEDEEEITNDNGSVCTDVTAPNDNVDTITSSNVTADVNIEYPYEVTATGYVRCVVCDCQVPSGIYNRGQHAKGMRHRNMVLNMTRKTIAADEEEQEDSSDGEELTDEVTAATEADGTAVNTTSSGVIFQIGYPYKSTKSGRILCVVCHCAVPGGERNREQHIRGLRHRNMVTRVKSREDGQGPTKDNLEYSNNEESVDENTEDNVTNGDNIDDSHIEYPFEVTDTGHVQCMVCNSLVANSVHDREEHIKEARHREIEEFRTELETFRSEISEQMNEIQLKINALKVLQARVAKNLRR